MIKILLICDQGASINLLRNKMLEYAHSIGISVYIDIRPLEEMNQHGYNYDVILVCPHVRMSLCDIDKIMLKKPIHVIDVKDYSLLEAGNILKHALTLYSKKNNLV